jgi:hypothetical protein
MPYSITALKSKLDTDYPTAGTFGYAALLDNLLKTGLTYTVDFSSDILTTVSAHGLVTGTRVRSTATVAQPGISPSGTLNGSTDYFVNVISTTELQLHLTLADAIASTNAVNFTDGGSGTLQLNEQALSAEDAIAVLINHELTHPDYFRKELVGMGSAFAASSEARKNSSAYTLTVNSSSPAMVFGYTLTIKNGLTTIGDTTGTTDFLDILSAAITIAAGDSKSYIVQFATTNV